MNVKKYFTGLKMLKSKLIWSLTLLAALLQLSLLNGSGNHHTLTIYTFSTQPITITLFEWTTVLLMPAFVYLCLCAIQKRFQLQKQNRAHTTTLTLIGFVLSFNFGATIAGGTYFDFSDYAGLLLIALPFIAFFLKAYRAECILGFALSLSWVFGTLSAITYSLVAALVCFALYKLRIYTLHCHRQNSEHIEIN